MKRNLIVLSASTACAATLLAILATLTATEGPGVITNFKLMAVAGYIGLLSISSFFLSIVTPKD